MGIEKYLKQLKEIENKFNQYEQDLDNIINQVSANIHHTVISKGVIVNPTPYYEETLGCKLNGKIIEAPIISNDCMKYHYDDQNRIIMVEQYSVHFEKFSITDIYLYNGDLAERLIFADVIFGRLCVFDNAFSNTTLCLSYAWRSGYFATEYIYEDNMLKEMRCYEDFFTYGTGTEIKKFIYEGQKLIQIEYTRQDGEKGLRYTTKRPNFTKIKDVAYNGLKKLITDYKGNFTSLGIEGFIDQQQPMFCVCFTNDSTPNNHIAEWNVEMHDVNLYDWQFNDTQMKKCIKIIAEIIVELVEEGLLKDKQIYFHQNQVCVTRFYSAAKSVFKKANIVVK